RLVIVEDSCCGYEKRKMVLMLNLSEGDGDEGGFWWLFVICDGDGR
ncbi:hypothetical protein A2U01_0060602, partial [Trifolium medium]|nr:hypothetical protein [Trifolium medium]